MTHESLANGLIAHWPFAHDCEEAVGSGLDVRNHGVVLDALGGDGKPAAVFNGQNAFLEVADHPVLKTGTGDFSIAGWVCTRAENDLVGDVVSKFDPSTRKGMQLYLLTNTGVTSTAQSNYRNLQFGIDSARLDADWTDCGRPGNAALVAALTVFDGELYAGTLEIGAGEIGRLWHYGGDGRWRDLGNPVGCNVVHSVAAFDGALYCGVGRYMCGGSMLGETLNTTPGGMVYRVDADGRWIYCGHPGAEDATPEETPTSSYSSGKADDVFALTAYGGNLYCASNHRRGVFVYEGGEKWKYIGPDLRIISLAVYHGRLYALINGGPVYRYEGGGDWVDCGRPETSTQTYSAVTCEGRLYVGTWPQGEVYCYAGDRAWAPVGSGRVGYEREIMGMALYNGKVYVGALPMGNMWRMDGQRFTFVGNLDASPVQLRRVWSMAVYGGRLFAGTLPSGRVRAIEAGKMATWDRAFPAGWHHVAAVKHRGMLRLYVNGRETAASAAFNPGYFDLSNDRPLQIGFGAHDYFSGRMRDLRLYSRALTETEITDLA